MSQDDVPETTFVELPPRNARTSPSSGGAGQAPPRVGHTPSHAAPAAPRVHQSQPKQARVGSGSISGYEVSASTENLRRQGSANLVWAAAGVGVGLALLAAGALLIASIS